MNDLASTDRILLNDDSNSCTLDLYDDILVADLNVRQELYEELQKKYQLAKNDILSLKTELESLQVNHAKLQNQNCVLLKNMSALCKTAHAEIARKETEIKSLRSRLDYNFYQRSNGYFQQPFYEDRTLYRQYPAKALGHLPSAYNKYTYVNTQSVSAGSKDMGGKISMNETVRNKLPDRDAISKQENFEKPVSGAIPSNDQKSKLDKSCMELESKSSVVRQNELDVEVSCCNKSEKLSDCREMPLPGRVEQHFVVSRSGLVQPKQPNFKKRDFDRSRTVKNSGERLEVGHPKRDFDRSGTVKNSGERLEVGHPKRDFDRSGTVKNSGERLEVGHPRRDFNRSGTVKNIGERLEVGHSRDFDRSIAKRLEVSHPKRVFDRSIAKRLEVGHPKRDVDRSTAKRLEVSHPKRDVDRSTAKRLEAGHPKRDVDRSIAKRLKVDHPKRDFDKSIAKRLEVGHPKKDCNRSGSVKNIGKRLDVGHPENYHFEDKRKSRHANSEFFNGFTDKADGSSGKRTGNLHSQKKTKIHKTLRKGLDKVGKVLHSEESHILWHHRRKDKKCLEENADLNPKEHQTKSNNWADKFKMSSKETQLASMHPLHHNYVNCQLAQTATKSNPRTGCSDYYTSRVYPDLQELDLVKIKESNVCSKGISLLSGIIKKCSEQSLSEKVKNCDDSDKLSCKNFVQDNSLINQHTNGFKQVYSLSEESDNSELVFSEAAVIATDGSASDSDSEQAGHCISPLYCSLQKTDSLHTVLLDKIKGNLGAKKHKKISNNQIGCQRDGIVECNGQNLNLYKEAEAATCAGDSKGSSRDFDFADSSLTTNTNRFTVSEYQMDEERINSEKSDSDDGADMMLGQSVIKKKSLFSSESDLESDDYQAGRFPKELHQVSSWHSFVLKNSETENHVLADNVSGDGVTEEEDGEKPVKNLMYDKELQASISGEAKIPLPVEVVIENSKEADYSRNALSQHLSSSAADGSFLHPSEIVTLQDTDDCKPSLITTSQLTPDTRYDCLDDELSVHALSDLDDDDDDDASHLESRECLISNANKNIYPDIEDDLSVECNDSVVGLQNKSNGYSILCRKRASVTEIAGQSGGEDGLVHNLTPEKHLEQDEDIQKLEEVKRQLELDLEELEEGELVSDVEEIVPKKTDFLSLSAMTFNGVKTGQEKRLFDDQQQHSNPRKRRTSKNSHTLLHNTSRSPKQTCTSSIGLYQMHCSGKSPATKPFIKILPALTPVLSNPVKKLPVFKEPPVREKEAKTDPVRHLSSRISPVRHSSFRISPVRHCSSRISPVRHSSSKILPARQPSSKISLVRQPLSRISPVRQPLSRISPVRQSSSRISPVRQSSSRISPVRQTSSRKSPIRQSSFRKPLALKTSFKNSVRSRGRTCSHGSKQPRRHTVHFPRR